VQVTDSTAVTPLTAFKQFRLDVVAPPDPAPPKLAITTASPLPSAMQGQPYSQTLTASWAYAPISGLTWSTIAGTLPDGLNLSPHGALPVTATTRGTSSFTLLTALQHHPATKAFMLAVGLPPLAITTATPLPFATSGQPYSQTLTASGGEAPYTWSIV